MAYLPASFASSTFGSVAPISFSPPLPAPFSTPTPMAASSFSRQLSPLVGTVLSVPPRDAASGSAAVGYPH